MKKKTKIALNRNRTHSSSSEDIDLPTRTTTTKSKQPSVPSPTAAVAAAARVQIQRSSSSASSDDSNGSDEIVTKRTRQRRKKSTTSNERSSILKQMKRKTEERKSSTTSNTTIPDKNNNTNHNESNGKKKCSFQFSDDDDDGDVANQNNRKTNDNDGETTESYEAEEDQVKKNGEIKKEQQEVDDDEEGENSLSKRNSLTGRKNIRKIIDDQELDIQTKNAVEAELERRKRITEKQKEYNDNLLEKSAYLANLENEQLNNPNCRLILELDPKSNEPLIEVSPKLVRQLKPHQCDGIRFLWNNVFESIDAIQNKQQQGNGCILAHCMGLGKTLQVISFIHTIFNYDQLTNIRTCLVLCPINAGRFAKRRKPCACTFV